MYTLIHKLCKRQIKGMCLISTQADKLTPSAISEIGCFNSKKNLQIYKVLTKNNNCPFAYLEIKDLNLESLLL